MTIKRMDHVSVVVAFERVRRVPRPAGIIVAPVRAVEPFTNL